MEVELKLGLTRVKLNGKLVNEFRGDQAVPESKMWFEPQPRGQGRVCYKEIRVNQ